jgi:sulfite reductase (ferredoxin)
MAEVKLSKVEGMKVASQHLRGTIAQSLASDAPQMPEADHQLLKFHGVYQGYDRDSATELKQRGEGKRIEFMIRIKTPGGRMSGAQYLALDELAQRFGGGKMRITTRQSIQFHGIAKGDLWATMNGINQALLTSFCACGDVVRTIMVSAAPYEDARHRRMCADADMLAAALEPQTRAYHEIWVGDENIVAAPALEPETDPLYGPTYLPRKFKIGIGTPEDNDIDILAANDLAVLPVFDGDDLVGYNFAVGGGLGLTHNKPHTYARIASPLIFVGPDELLDTVRAVIALQRDNGDRADRRHARLKYVVDAKGLDWVKVDLERRLGKTLQPSQPLGRFHVKDHQGWHKQGDGKWFLGLPVKAGRIEDKGSIRLATAFRRVIAEIGVRPVLSPNQDIYFADVADADRARVEAILVAEGVELPGAWTPIRRWAMACPALPTCGLALNEAERVLDDIVADIEGVLARHHMAGERISLRITGCPNGCARPYVGDIGLVGRTPDTYAVFLGGDFEGTRLNSRVFERVKIDAIGKTLEPVIALWARHREGHEAFGNFCHRWGVDRLAALVPTAEAAE